MREYKQWTAAERNRSLRLTNKAKKLGLIPPPAQCSICGKTEGTLQYHNEDYDATLNFTSKLIDGTITEAEKKAIFASLTPVCKGCHIRLHKAYLKAEAEAAAESAE